MSIKSAGRIIYYKKGEYYQYCVGHANRINQPPEVAQPFKIQGVYCRLVGLTQGQYAIVDAEDYARVIQWKWSARWNKWTNTFYAVRSDRSEKGVHRTILMHRFLLLTDAPHVDHENHVTLDNRRKNLRPATVPQNRWNQGPNSLNKSGYKGVHLRTLAKPWVAKINRKLIGYFRTAEEAARAVDAEAIRTHGEFAWLNFPK